VEQLKGRVVAEGRHKAEAMGEDEVEASKVVEQEPAQIYFSKDTPRS